MPIQYDTYSTKIITSIYLRSRWHPNSLFHSNITLDVDTANHQWTQITILQSHECKLGSDWEERDEIWQL